MASGLVFNIQKFSLRDGPGIRTTVFLKGCPLCCSWCHNPEGTAPYREIITLEGRCIACGECRAACSFAASLPGVGPLPSSNPECTLCQECIDACPTGARDVAGREMTAEEVIGRIMDDRLFYEESGGGATFSGGEPLMQPEFLRALLAGCRGNGIHTALDTCGYACTNLLLEMARLADLVLYDVKLMDDARHREFTGVPNGPILENLRLLAKEHGRIWLRVPLIPGISDQPENLRSIGELAASLPNIRQVQLLPYHRTGAQKFRRLGMEYRLSGTRPPSAEDIEAAVALFRAVGVAAAIG